MSLLSLISKPLFQPTWLVITQAEAELHKRIKLDQKGTTGTGKSLETCSTTSMDFSMITSNVLIATKKVLDRKPYIRWTECGVFLLLVK